MTDITDSNLPELLSCLRTYLQQHEYPGKSFELLQALTNLTIERLAKGEDLKIKSISLQVLIYGEISDNSPGSILAAPWKVLLEKKLPEREIGIQEFYSQNGFDQYLWPQKDKSPGGAGNPSTYYFVTRDIPKPQESSENKSITASGEIRYIPEITPRPAWWLKKLLEGGYALHGWRQSLFIGFGLAIFLMTVLVLLITYLLLLYSSNPSLKVVLSLVIFSAIITWFSYSILSTILSLLNWRMIKAPDILVSLREDNVLLELVNAQCESSKPSKVIRLVRYAASCPICKGKIEVVDGKKEFPNRFVGRCNENPAEHVYSFDRVRLDGKLLR